MSGDKDQSSKSSINSLSWCCDCDGSTIPIWMCPCSATRQSFVSLTHGHRLRKRRGVSRKRLFLSAKQKGAVGLSLSVLEAVTIVSFLQEALSPRKNYRLMPNTMPPMKRPPPPPSMSMEFDWMSGPLTDDTAKRPRHQDPSPDCIVMNPWWLRKKQQQQPQFVDACRFCQAPMTKMIHFDRNNKPPSRTLLHFYETTRPVTSEPMCSITTSNRAGRACHYCDRTDQCDDCLVTCERCGESFCLFCRSYDHGTTVCLVCHQGAVEVSTGDDMEMG